MAKKLGTVLKELTTVQLKRLLAARERIDVLEGEKARLLKELAAVDRELEKLMAAATSAPGGAARTRRAGRKAAGKKKTRKKTAKKATRKKTVKKTAKKATRKKTAKKTAKRTVKKAPRRKTTKKAAGKAPRVPLEDVIVAVLRKHGGSMSFKDLHATIVDGKLYRSKAAKFDNVLRRTLSTSKKVKRVGRGVYAAA